MDLLAVLFLTLGSFSNDDGDSNENVNNDNKKNNRLNSQNNSVMPALKRTRLTASAWRKANWCINCVLMRVMERRERDNS